MSNRGRRGVVGAIGEVKPLSADSTLLWERFQGPMQAAAAQFNAAIANATNILGAIIIEKEGLDPKEYLLDVDHMRIIPRPHPKGEKNGG